MKANTFRCLAIGALLALVFSRGHLAADSPTATKKLPPDIKNLPAPADVRELQASPREIRLVGADETRQLLLTGALETRLQDLTGEVKYEVADPTIVRVSASGRVTPLANGSTTIIARFGDKSATVSVKTEAVDESLPINFANRVVPIFTKLGCNSGGCHGKSGGQNGFALSLLGFVPELDYQTLVKENRGRRLLTLADQG